MMIIGAGMGDFQSRKSTQKRQKQYFEQRKRKQQNLHIMGSDNCYDSPGISGQSLKEHRSLDILNLLNLSTKAQQCSPFCPEERDDGDIDISTLPVNVSTDQPTMFTNMDTTVNSFRFEEARVLLITAILPLMDPPINGRQYPINTRNFLLLIWCVMMNLMPLQKSVPPAKIMFLFHLKDTMVQDIKVSPISSSDFPFNKLRRSSGNVGNGNRFYDIDNRNGSADREKFFYKTENSDGDLWNACSVFLDETFDNEMGYDTSCKKTFQMGSKSPELSKSGTYKLENYAFEDLLPKKWSSAVAMKQMDMGEPRSSFSKDELEEDFDFYVASRSRLDGNFDAQNFIPEDEELGPRNSWHFEERKPSFDKSSVAAPFCLDLETDFTVFGSKNRIEDPFNVFNTLELSDKASPCFGGFNKTAPRADSAPCSFTSQKLACDCSAAFPNVDSWPTSPSLSPDFHFKGKSEDAGGFHCATSSTDMSGQGSVCKSEKQVKLQKDRRKNFDQENVFMGDDELSSEKKLADDAPSFKNHEQECEGTEDTNPKASATECRVTADSSGHVEEISSLLKRPDKEESQVDKRKFNNLVNFIDLFVDMQLWLPEERKKSEKHNNDTISLSGQVMFESFVFQLLHVQKVLKEAPT
ncbi:uncharacterized protein HKW66_Vig0076040 [Vigna angularis]|uniref:Uncharacterized protein n=1 Tax=Phaseolus angularis TaxID=3914 RepID=A0A8T0K5Y0_PHAAN|nr:uncharacterized protein HKW66_Vig0076040 [Vigna angularis]